VCLRDSLKAPVSFVISIRPSVLLSACTSAASTERIFVKLGIGDLFHTYSVVQSPSWEANWFAACPEIPRISRNPKVHYPTHKRPPPVSILAQPNPVHIPTSHLLEIRPNIIHHLRLGLPSGLFPSGFPPRPYTRPFPSTKIFEKTPVLLKSDRNVGRSTWRPEYIYTVGNSMKYLQLENIGLGNHSCVSLTTLNTYIVDGYV